MAYRGGSVDDFDLGIFVAAMLGRLIAFRQKQHDGRLALSRLERAPHGGFAVVYLFMRDAFGRIRGQFGADVFHAFVRGVFFGVDD